MKRRVTLLLLTLLATSLAACQTSRQKAHELAEQAVYKPVEYANAATPGPHVVVLAGEIKSANATFTQKVTENNIRDFAELELSKANFQVLERADTQEFFNEFALAANLGDAEALAVFKKGAFKATNWLVAFDVLKAEPVADVSQSVDGTTAGVLVGLALTLAGSSDAGRIAGSTIASIKGSERSIIWNVGLRYKILDANTGLQVATGYFEDKMEIMASMQSFLGATQAQTSVMTLDTLVQRLVQKAVQEIDASYKTGSPPGQVEIADVGQLVQDAVRRKTGDASLAASPDQAADAGAKPLTVSAAKEKKILAEYQLKAAENRKQKDADAILGVVKNYFGAVAQIDQAALYACTCQGERQNVDKGMEPLFKVAASTPDWRKNLVIDVSGVAYELVEQTEDRGTVKVTGPVAITIGNAAPKVTAQDDHYDVTRENGRWLVCSTHFQ